GGGGGGGGAGSRRLWQCTWCSVAFCMKHLPPQLATAGRKARVADANQCVHCRSPSPRVKLAILLEGMCSRIANHHLAIPFLRPFMPGIASSFGDDDDANDYKEEEEEEEEDGRNALSAGATHPVQGASVGGRGEVRSSSGGAVANGQPFPSRPAAAAAAAGPGSPAGAGANLNSSCAAATGVAVAAKYSKKRATSGGGGGSSRSSRANGVVEVGVADAPVEDIMGLLDKTRALGYSRSAELMADVRTLQGKCRKAITDWGGDPVTGGGFGEGSGRMVVRAMDTLAAMLEGLLGRSREELTNVEGDIAKKTEREHRRQTDRGVGDGSADGGFPWRGECLPPRARPAPASPAAAAAAAAATAAAEALVANGRRSRGAGGRGSAKAEVCAAVAGDGASAGAGAGVGAAVKRLPPLRMTRRWSLASWAEFLQNAPVLRRSTGHAVPGERITVNGTEVLGTQQLRESLAEGMRSPAVLPNPEDSDDSDGYMFSDSDCAVSAAAAAAGGGYGYGSRGGGAAGAGGGDGMAPVPEWSELETAVQALMGMEGGEERECEDLWDATESRRLVQMESVLEEQRRLMRRVMRHNGNLRALWRKYAASPLEDRGSQGAEGVVTLGETRVLTEFQISNDLLRKRVQDLEEQLRAKSALEEGSFPAAPATAPLFHGVPGQIGNGTSEPPAAGAYGGSGAGHAAHVRVGRGAPGPTFQGAGGGGGGSQNLAFRSSSSAQDIKENGGGFKAT
ncbi:unnamed protein product, partial [Ectocarpus sp. 8 AP-2014]